jgi:8-oxo-dGTP pyrophosphatase MutT (NUDIX family)
MTWSMFGSVLAEAQEHLPAWLDPVTEMARTVQVHDITQFAPTGEGGRHSAVLILFGDGENGPDVLLIERAAAMRAHAGQPAFPGGAVDPDDAGPVATALREAHEETGLDPAGVLPFGLLPDLFLPITNFVVTPVLGWWREPSAVYAATPAEVASVHRIAISDLVNPANRCLVRHPSGYIGPGFEVHGLLVWGFTGGILSAIMKWTGWEQPWSNERIVDLPAVVIDEL